MSTLNDIETEANKAEKIYGPFMSTHEALGVLTEELAELVEAIRSNKLWSVHAEAIQVAAVAKRLAEVISQTDSERSDFWKRSTGK